MGVTPQFLGVDTLSKARVRVEVFAGEVRPSLSAVITSINPDPIQSAGFAHITTCSICSICTNLKSFIF